MDDRDLAIRTRGLTRYFGRKCAVYQMDLAVPRGSVFAFLGRNGSGKTTSIRMILGLLPATRGSAALLGHDSRALPPAVRGRIAYLPENHPVVGWMRVRDCGRFESKFHPRWSWDGFHSVTDYFRLDPAARARDLSRGERAGLCLALTLAMDPELLILDDPALGLDPVAHRAFLEAMVHVAGRPDRTIFLSTHRVDDVERVADHVAVLTRSILKAHCPLDRFRESVRRFVLRFPGQAPEAAGSSLPELSADLAGFLGVEAVLEVLRAREELRITLVDRAGKSAAILEKLRSLAPSADEVPISLEEALVCFLGGGGERRSLMPGGLGDKPAEAAGSSREEVNS